MLYVITGPPAAGKSSWIDAHATARDVVIDLDRITQALTGPGAPTWNQDQLQLRVAHRARYAAMDEAFTLRDKTDVYLIHTMPSAKARAKYKRLDARIITVDPGRDVVMQRIAAMRDPTMKRVAARWYNARQAAAHAAAPRSPLTAHRSPLTAHRSPLTAHLVIMAPPPFLRAFPGDPNALLARFFARGLYSLIRWP